MENFHQLLGFCSVRWDIVPEFWQASCDQEHAATEGFEHDYDAPRAISLSPRPYQAIAPRQSTTPLPSSQVQSTNYGSSFLSYHPHGSFSDYSPVSSCHDAELESPPPYTPPYAPYIRNITTLSQCSTNSPPQCTTFPPLSRQTSASTDDQPSTCSYEERRRAQNRASQRTARLRQIARQKKDEATIEDLSRKVKRLEQEKGELEQKLEMTEGMLRKVVVQRLGGEG